MRPLVITQNITVDGSIEMLDDWFDPTDSPPDQQEILARGIATDVAPTAAKLGKQIKYADKLGIPYVWFPADRSDPEAVDEVKNIVTGDQEPADAKSWEPDTLVARQTVKIQGVEAA